MCTSCPCDSNLVVVSVTSAVITTRPRCNSWLHPWDAGHSEPRPAKRAKTATKPPTCIVLDIEGTVAPISFVAEVMFPYAQKHLRTHLEATFESQETQEDIALIRKQAGDDAKADGGSGPGPVPSSGKPQVGAAWPRTLASACAPDLLDISLN